MTTISDQLALILIYIKIFFIKNILYIQNIDNHYKQPYWNKVSYEFSKF